MQRCVRICPLLFLFHLCHSHSWVECTKYDISLSIDDNSYSNDDCSGWIRGWRNYGPDDFGEDHGADYEITDESDNMCERSIGDPNDSYSTSYTDGFIIANYTVGETIRLLWPAKNHANYECSAHQLDHEMKLYVNTNPNPTQDLSANTTEWTLVRMFYTFFLFVCFS